MKKFICIILSAATILCMAACSTNDDVNTTAEPDDGVADVTAVPGTVDDDELSNGVNAWEDESEEVFGTETWLGTIYYPSKWKEKVTIEANDNDIIFYCGTTELFEFTKNGSDDDYMVGTYDGVEFFLRDFLIEDAEMAQMQEDVNFILTRLEADDKFVEN